MRKEHEKPRNLALSDTGIDVADKASLEDINVLNPLPIQSSSNDSEVPQSTGFAEAELKQDESSHSNIRSRFERALGLNQIETPAPKPTKYEITLTDGVVHYIENKKLASAVQFMLDHAEDGFTYPELALYLEGGTNSPQNHLVGVIKSHAVRQLQKWGYRQDITFAEKNRVFRFVKVGVDAERKALPVLTLKALSEIGSLLFNKRKTSIVKDGKLYKMGLSDEAKRMYGEVLVEYDVNNSPVLPIALRTSAHEYRDTLQMAFSHLLSEEKDAFLQIQDERGRVLLEELDRLNTIGVLKDKAYDFLINPNFEFVHV